MELDFDATDEINDYVTVPPGTYLCRVAEVRQRTTRNGEPLWSLRLLVAEGEYTGRQAAWDNLVFSTRGRARVRRVFEALGLPASGKVSFEPNMIEGREAFVEVRHAEYRNTAGTLVRRNEVPYEGYRPVTRENGVAALPPSGTQRQSEEAPSAADEDIPF